MSRPCSLQQDRDLINEYYHFTVDIHDTISISTTWCPSTEAHMQPIVQCALPDPIHPDEAAIKQHPMLTVQSDWFNPMPQKVKCHAGLQF